MRASNGFSVTYPSSIEFSNAILNINLAIASLLRIRLVAVSDDVKIKSNK